MKVNLSPHYVAAKPANISPKSSQTYSTDLTFCSRNPNVVYASVLALVVSLSCGAFGAALFIGTNTFIGNLDAEAAKKTMNEVKSFITPGEFKNYQDQFNRLLVEQEIAHTRFNKGMELKLQREFWGKIAKEITQQVLDTARRK